MQQENQTSSDFLRRTDALALKLGKNVQELSEVLGISRAMLFGYRKGKNAISGKAWLKLETAEKDAEKGQADTCQLASQEKKRVKPTRDTLGKGSSEEIDWDAPLPPEIAGPLMKAAEGARERFEAMMKAEIGGLREEVARLREAVVERLDRLEESRETRDARREGREDEEARTR